MVVQAALSAVVMPGGYFCKATKKRWRRSMSYKTLAVAGIAAVAACAIPANAHHSFAMFDALKIVQLEDLAQPGVKRLAVLTPGFSADCLETIEEIGEENAGYFREAGGEEFARIACLNDSEGGMRVIEAIVSRELQGWI